MLKHLTISFNQPWIIKFVVEVNRLYMNYAFALGGPIVEYIGLVKTTPCIATIVPVVQICFYSNYDRSHACLVTSSRFSWIWRFE